MPDFLYVELIGKPLWMWGVFLALVLFLLGLDLGILHRRNRSMDVKESLRMSGFYIVIALLFSLFVWRYAGLEAAENYLNGYVIEKTLSMDNLFVMSLIFGAFSIPRENQYRVLFWGILGVIVLRGIMIGVGTELVRQFEWTLYVFAVFLIITGIKMLVTDDKPVEIEKNPLLQWARRHLRMTTQLHGNRFFVRQEVAGKRALFVTPLFVALLVIEFADIIFAVDSVPAIFAITSDTYVVYTSNIFAILGLRALYFALAAMVHRFEYLGVSLAILLIFIGSKIFIADFLGLEKFPQSLSLGITLAILGSGICYSLWKTRDEKR